MDDRVVGPSVDMSAVPGQDDERRGGVPDEVALLAEVLTARAEGSNDTRAGTSDGDLLYAIEEALPHLERMRGELDA